MCRADGYGDGLINSYDYSFGLIQGIKYNPRSNKLYLEFDLTVAVTLSGRLCRIGLRNH